MREGPRFIGRSTARIRRGAVTTGNWARAGEPGLRVLFPGLPVFAAADGDRIPTPKLQDTKKNDGPLACARRL